MMLKELMQGVARLFSPFSITPESELVDCFLAEPQLFVEELTKYMLMRSTFFSHSGSHYWSDGGRIRVCMDVYGPEVIIGWNGMMLDCYPDAYGLRKEQAMALYMAILSNVPGTGPSTEKLERKLAANFLNEEG